MKKRHLLTAIMAATTCVMANDGNWEGAFKLPGGVCVMHSPTWTKIESPDGGVIQAGKGISMTARFINFGSYEPYGTHVELTTGSTPQKFYGAIRAFAEVVDIQPPALRALLLGNK